MNLICMIVLAMWVFATANGESDLTSGTIYKIISTVDHTVLNIPGGLAANGNNVTTEAWGNTADQLWIAEPISSDTTNVYVLSTVLNNQFALDSSQKSIGEPIIHERNGNSNQQWYIEPIEPKSFTYYIRNFFNCNRVLELDADRQGVSLKWKKETNINQRWIFAVRITNDSNL